MFEHQKVVSTFKREKESMFVSPPEGADLPSAETETSIAQGNNKLGTIAEGRAKRLLNRVQKGESLSEAASAERMTVADLKDPDNPIRASIQQLIGTYFLPPEARKQMVRAGLNKLFADNINSADPADKKIALDAAKQIGSDPEVGLGGEAGGGVIINIGELEGVFQQLRAQKAPEILDGRQTTNQSIEAEFSDIPAGGDQSDSLPNVLGGQSAGDKSEVISSE